MDVDGFSIYRSLNAGDTWSLYHTVASATARSWRDYGENGQGLENGTKYTYRVRAYVDTGNPAAPRSYSVTTNKYWTVTNLPGPGEAAEASSFAQNSVTLTWNDNTSNETGFEIEHTDADGNVTIIALNGRNDAATKSHTVTGLAAGKRYTIRVRAVTLAQKSAWSPAMHITTLPANVWPYEPSEAFPALLGDPDPAFDGSRVLLKGAQVNVDSNAIELRDVATGALLHTFSPPAGVRQFGAAKAFLAADEIVINGWSGTPLVEEQSFAFVYDSSGQLLRTIAGPRGAGEGMPQLIVSGNRIIMAGRNGAYAYDAQTGVELQDFYVPGRENQTRVLGIAASDTRVLFRTELQRVHLFDLATGDLLHTFQHPTHPNNPSSHWFGTSMALWGTDVLINSRSSSTEVRDHEVFHYDGSTSFNLMRSYYNPTPFSSETEGFGSRFVLSGDELIIRGADVQSGEAPEWWEGPFWVDRGEQHVFDLPTNRLIQTIARPPGTDGFAISRAANGVLLATGFVGDSEMTPQTHVFRRAARMRFDANRDGEIVLHATDTAISDQTSAERPYRFWLNDDRDGAESVANPELLVDLPVLAGQTDFDRHGIENTRDLEDLTRFEIGLPRNWIWTHRTCRSYFAQPTSRILTSNSITQNPMASTTSSMRRWRRMIYRRQY